MENKTLSQLLDAKTRLAIINNEQKLVLVYGCAEMVAQEYSDQNTKPLVDEIAELRKEVEYQKSGYITLKEYLKTDDILGAIAKLKSELKASKSEANEAVFTESQVNDLIETVCFRLRSGFFKSLDLKHKSIDRIKNEDYTSWKNEIFKTRNNK